MASFEITRTELVWPGKYDDGGQLVTPPRVSLPFQTIETINESRATREARKRPEQTTLFDVWTGDEGDTLEEGWRNKLIWGNNLPIMSSLLERFAGRINFVYIDPPFATGADFNVTAQVGEQGDELEKEQSIIEEKAYRDTWAAGMASFSATLAPRLALLRDLLAEDGSAVVHLDSTAGPYVRLLLDEIFGRQNFLNEIIWSYSTSGRPEDRFPQKHDNLFWYRRGAKHAFYPEQARVPYSQEYLDSHFTDVDEQGRRCRRRFDAGKWRVYYPDQGMLPNSVWDIPYVNSQAGERTGYPTQKPEPLLERLINATTKPGDIVADFFVGSGTTAGVAEKLGRRWIACDLGRFAIHTTRKRLMGISGCKPFEVLNLGKYERQFWQQASFGSRDVELVLFEYVAFLLHVYGAEPLPGMQHLHGRRGRAVVHIGAVDAPVTITEVTDALDECVATGQQELHVLGWEWEMGLNDLVDQLAQERHVRLRLLAIPREVMEAQAVDQGDIRFFELAHLECVLEPGPDCSLSVELTNFAMSDADAIDDDVRSKITKWSDFVDYWAIDHDFQNDTFMNGWVAYRTRKDRRLTLRSDLHRYPEAGTYRVAIKVVDIFGNDTTKVFPVEVK